MIPTFRPEAHELLCATHRTLRLLFCLSGARNVSQTTITHACPFSAVASKTPLRRPLCA